MKFQRLAAFFVSGALVACCASPAFAAPPTVLTVSPAPGSTGVPLLSQGLLQIHFDQAMDPNSVNAVSLTPYNAAISWRLNGVFGWSNSNSTLTFLPSCNRCDPFDSLPAATTVVVTISTTATNALGQPLSAPYQWSFSTKPAVVTGANVKNTIVGAYDQFFARAVPQPAYFANFVTLPHYWISTAYLDDELFRLYVLEDGTVLPWGGRTSHKPRGTYRVAVVAIDYGNTNIAAVLNTDWAAAQDAINSGYRDIALSLGLTEPILQFTNVNFLAQRSEIGNPFNRDDILSLITSRGRSPADFDLFAVLNLDPPHPGGGGWMEPDFAYMNWTGSAAPTLVLSPQDLKNLARSVYNHEFGHGFGWEHSWSGNSASVNLITDWALFGWTDTDGDRMPEILDRTPYGTRAPAISVMATGDIDGNGQDDVVVDFGATYGLWIWSDATTWKQLHALSAKALVTGDLDGNGLQEILIDFGPGYGLWIWSNNSNWVRLHAASPKTMTIGDLDGNGRDDVLIDFGGVYGLWVWKNNSTWEQLHARTARMAVAGDLDRNGQDEAIVDFGVPPWWRYPFEPYGSSGVYAWTNNSAWVPIHTLSPAAMITADIDGNGRAEVIFDFGASRGLWIWLNNSSWVQLHSLSPKSMVAADLDGNGQDEIIIDFGPGVGIWVLLNNSSWIKLHDLSPETMTVGDLDGNGKDDVFIDFGNAYGLWLWKNNSIWLRAHSLSPAGRNDP